MTLNIGLGKAVKIVPRQAYSSKLYITYSLKPLKLLKISLLFLGRSINPIGNPFENTANPIPVIKADIPCAEFLYENLF